MSRRVRIPSVGELQTIKDHGLHQALVGDLLDDVRNALEALDRGLQEDEICLETVVETLAGLLPAQPGIRKIAEEVAELGGSTISAERDVYMALAKWIIDNQIGRGFDWEALTPPERRG